METGVVLCSPNVAIESIDYGPIFKPNHLSKQAFLAWGGQNTPSNGFHLKMHHVGSGRSTTTYPTAASTRPLCAGGYVCNSQSFPFSSHLLRTHGSTTTPLSAHFWANHGAHTDRDSYRHVCLQLALRASFSNLFACRCTCSRTSISLISNLTCFRSGIRPLSSRVRVDPPPGLLSFSVKRREMFTGRRGVSIKRGAIA